LVDRFEYFGESFCFHVHIQEEEVKCEMITRARDDKGPIGLK
jgi:hypothetical protein